MDHTESSRATLLARLAEWDGISIKEAGESVLVMLRGQVLARFMTEETVEIPLCGPIRRQIAENPEIIAEGVWPVGEHSRLLMDLNQPGAVEEAIRALLNAYIEGHQHANGEAFLSAGHLESDPAGACALKTIEGYRRLIRERGYSLYPEAARV